MSITYNKRPKDPKLCKLINKVIKRQRIEIDMTKEEIAHDLGLELGTLENKLKPSYPTGDLNLTEFIHFLELTGDYSALDYIAKEFDFTLIKNDDVKASCKEIHILIDNLSMEEGDVFRSAKEALRDGEISEDEKIKVSTEIDQVVKAALELKKKLRDM